MIGSKIAIFLIVIFKAYFSSENTSICSSQKYCDQCIKSFYLCAWCKDQNYGDIRCGTVDELKSRSCKDIEYKNTSVALISSNKTNTFFNIEPSLIDIDFAKNASISFQINVTKLKNFNSQAMFIMDLSWSMNVTIDKIKKLIKDFVSQKDKLQVSEIGLWKFIDKVSHPFIDIRTVSWDTGPFYMELIQSLTNDSTLLFNQLDKHKNGVNADMPEAVFDAITECALCTEQVKWSNDSTILKTIFLFTDQRSKFQGDARAIGVITPHNLKCHLNLNDKIELGLDYDYVSVSQAATALRENGIQLVSIVATDVVNYYKLVGKALRGVRWLVHDLGSQEIDLGEIITEANKDLNSMISLDYGLNDDVELDISVECPPNANKVTSSQCNNVPIGEQVTFTVNAKLLGSKNSNVLFKVSSVETVSMNYHEFENCDCVSEINTPKCSSSGNLTCGICECSDGRMGSRCQCDTLIATSKTKCIDPNTKLICSNRGVCDECNDCVCKMANDGLSYTGKYCECSRALCSNINGLVCGGSNHGKCECDKCVCTPEYTGVNCETPICDVEDSYQKCIYQNETDACSSAGECICGVCQCYPGREGNFCEKEIEYHSCSSFQQILDCYTMANRKDDETSCNTDGYNISEETGDIYQCVIINEEGCKIYFNFTIHDQKNNISIQLKPIDSIKDCTAPINVALITGVIFAVVVGLGILLIILYIIAMLCFKREQTKRFQKEIKQSAQGEANPIYESGGNQQVQV